MAAVYEDMIAIDTEKKKKTFNDQRDDKEKQQWVLQQRNAEKAHISLKACF